MESRSPASFGARLSGFLLGLDLAPEFADVAFGLSGLVGENVGMAADQLFIDGVDADLRY